MTPTKSDTAPASGALIVAAVLEFAGQLSVAPAFCVGSDQDTGPLLDHLERFFRERDLLTSFVETSLPWSRYAKVACSSPLKAEEEHEEDDADEV